MTLLERPCPDWTIERVFHARIDRHHDPAALRELAALEPLSPEWRAMFAERAAKVSGTST
jgi:MOSC domain-containing protein YiiM